MNYQIREQANGKFSVYSKSDGDVNLWDETLHGIDLTAAEAIALVKTLPRS